MLKRLAPWYCLVVALAGCKTDGPTPSPQSTVRVFAAASTRAVVEQLAADFEATTGIPVRCEAAASSTLARQIEHGDDADLFLSADEQWADYLANKGLAAAIQPLLTNRLVV